MMGTEAEAEQARAAAVAALQRLNRSAAGA
jgi:hypothetical protein